MLDETLQFRADALEALRQPLESGNVTIARVDGAVTLPARFVLLAAFNPCPCGWSGVASRDCSCDDGQRRRYLARLSGPVRDRIDLHVTMEAAPYGQPSARGESSDEVRSRIERTWLAQLDRQGRANGELEPHQLTEATGFRASLARDLDRQARRFQLSPRRLHRAARVARTIADIAGATQVEVAHVAEALVYRPLASEAAA